MVNDPSPLVLEKQNGNVSTEKLKILKTMRIFNINTSSQNDIKTKNENLPTFRLQTLSTDQCLTMNGASEMF